MHRICGESDKLKKFKEKFDKLATAMVGLGLKREIGLCSRFQIDLTISLVTSRFKKPGIILAQFNIYHIEM
ncbi:MAG: hypothetical protein RBG13Loki_1337 [Promethearchaeota archaeon CR_4]|nr:MAG: hypothetical protein RBG13Loki_1337 [Candidatus Lokiarchaeota archaeon CR_4]